MPQLANIVLQDSAATPVDHTYTPRDIVDGVATVIEGSGVPIGDNSVSWSLRKTPSGRYKGIIRARFPIVQTQTINGVSTPVVVRQANCELTVNFDATSTEQERKDACRLMQTILRSSNPAVWDCFTKLQGVY